MDRTQSRCDLEILFDKDTHQPMQMTLRVLVGRRNQQGVTAKGDAAFSEGVEHIVFNYAYEFDFSERVAPAKLPEAVKKLLK